jgi:hypothetical protein
MKRSLGIFVLSLLSACRVLAAAGGIDVRDFGAVADDDRDDAAAIQAAIDAAVLKRLPVTFPAGTFLVSRRINPGTGGTTIQGTTTLRWDGDRVVADTQTILKSTGNESVFYFRGDGLNLKNLTFQGRGIFCDRPGDSMVTGLSIDNCWFSIDVRGEHDNSVEFTTGLADSRITNCVFDPILADNGIYGYNWSSLVIANNHFLNGNEGIHLVAHWDPSKNLLIEQNYFAGLHRMGVEIQGGGINTVVQDNYYEKPVMTDRFKDNDATFAYSIISDRSIGTRVRRNTSIAPERPDKTGVRIVFELGGRDNVCEDNYSTGGCKVAILNTSRDGRIIDNRFTGYLEGPSAFDGRAFGAIVRNNSPDVQLTWDFNRGKPGPNKSVPTTRPMP